MNEESLKRCAKSLRSQLAPRLGPGFKHGHALDLIAALVDCREWNEVMPRIKRGKLCGELDLEATRRLADKLERDYDIRLDPEQLLLQWTDGNHIAPKPIVFSVGVPKRWVCDVCREEVEAAERGYVIWKSEPGKPCYDWKIVHQGECDLDDYDGSAALVDFLGIEGLNVALSYLDSGPFATAAAGPGSSTPNLREFVDFIRRVQIPYYDLARTRFGNPRVIEDFSDQAVGVLTPETCKRIAFDTSYDD